MLPVIPILCACGFIASALGISWYESLSKDDQADADRLAADLAWRLYETTVDKLTQQQLQVVASHVRRSLGC